MNKNCVFYSTFFAALLLLLSVTQSFAQVSSPQKQATERRAASLYLPYSNSLQGRELEYFSIKLSEAVEASKQAASITQTSVHIKDATLVLGCPSPTTSCLQEIASQTNAASIYFVEIERKGDFYRVVFHEYERQNSELHTMERLIEEKAGVYDFFYRLALSYFNGNILSTTLVVNDSSKIDVFVGNENFGNPPLTIETLTPGTYTVSGRYDGKVQWNQTVVLGNQKLSEIVKSTWIDIPSTTSSTSLESSTSTTGTSMPELASTDPSFFSKVHWGSWALIGGGATAMAASMVFGYLIQREEADVDEVYRKYRKIFVLKEGEPMDGSKKRRRRDHLRKLYDYHVLRGETFQILHYTFLGVGVAAVLGGVGWMSYDLIHYQPEKREVSSRSLEAAYLPSSGASGIIWSFSILPNQIHTQVIW